MSHVQDLASWMAPTSFEVHSGRQTVLKAPEVDSRNPGPSLKVALELERKGTPGREKQQQRGQCSIRNPLPTFHPEQQVRLYGHESSTSDD